MAAILRPPPPEVEPLPGYKPPRPMVYCGLYPTSPKDFESLRKALQTDGISVHFQPIVRLADRSIAGFEVLARWNHPKRGAISPSEFIPVAEQSGLINELGIERNEFEALRASGVIGTKPGVRA